MAARVPPERLQAALKLLCGYKPAPDIECELEAMFNISKRVARRAVAAARAQLAEHTVVDREHERAKVRGVLERVIAENLDKGYHRIVLQAVDALVALDGLSEAQRIAIEHGFTPDSPVLGKRALAERMAELDARAKAEGDGKPN